MLLCMCDGVEWRKYGPSSVETVSWGYLEDIERNISGNVPPPRHSPLGVNETVRW